MSDITQAFASAFGLFVSRDPALREIVLLPRRVSLTAVTLASIIGLPLGATNKSYPYAVPTSGEAQNFVYFSGLHKSWLVKFGSFRGDQPNPPEAVSPRSDRRY